MGVSQLLVLEREEELGGIRTKCENETLMKRETGAVISEHRTNRKLINDGVV